VIHPNSLPQPAREAKFSDLSTSAARRACRRGWHPSRRRPPAGRGPPAPRRCPRGVSGCGCRLQPALPGARIRARPIIASRRGGAVSACVRLARWKSAPMPGKPVTGQRRPQVFLHRTKMLGVDPRYQPHNWGFGGLSPSFRINSRSNSREDWLEPARNCSQAACTISCWVRPSSGARTAGLSSSNA
jgi:hypothetical protein